MTTFKHTLYGFGTSYALFFSQKYEKHVRYIYMDFKRNYKFFNKKITNTFPQSIALHKKQTLNIYTLDMIQSYKSIRHSRGLPCRGQRT